VKGNVSNNVVYVEQTSVVYPAGNFLVKYNIATRVQEAFPCSEKGAGVTALAVSPSRRFVAVAELSTSAQDGCIVSVYNAKTMSKRRTMVTGASVPAPGGLRSLSFSADESMLVVLGAGTGEAAADSASSSSSSPAGGVVAVLHPDKSAVLACVPCAAVGAGTGAPSHSIQGRGASFSPYHPDKLCVWGANLLAHLVLTELTPEQAQQGLGGAPGLTHVLSPLPPSPGLLAWLAPSLSALHDDAHHSSSSSSTGGDGEGGSSSPSALTQQGSMRGSPVRGGGAGAAGGAAALLRSPGSPPPLLRNASSMSGVPFSPAGSVASDGVTFTAHAWLSSHDHSVVATRRGDLLLFQRETFIRVLPASPADDRALDVIAPSSKGFLTAGEAGFVRIFEAKADDGGVASPTSAANGGGSRGSRRPGASRSAGKRGNAADGSSSGDEPVADPGPYVCVRSLQASVAGLESEDRIRSLSLSPSGETAVFSLAGTQLIQLDVANANVKDESTAFTPIGPPSHAPPVGLSCAPGGSGDLCGVISMSVAARKPYVATVGVDSSVRVWNYVEKTCEMVKFFPEGPTSVALHPSGLLAVVGFQDRLRLMTVTLDDLRDLRSYQIKGCVEARFSRGGSLFAAVNGNVILVYSAYTGEYLQTLRGHNGKVISVQWAYNDATLLSVASDGAVYEWDMRDGKRARELTLKGAHFWSVCPSKDGATLLTVGDGGLAHEDGTYSGPEPALREIDMNAGVVIREWALPFHLSAIVASTSQPRLLFASAGEEGRPGSIRAFPSPLPAPAGAGGALVGPDFGGCAGPVARMALSHDDAFLFVAGADGSVVVYDVRDSAGRVPVSESSVKVPWAEETLVTLADLEERKLAVRELRDTVSELQGNAAYNLRMKDMAFEDELKRMAERAHTEIEQLRHQADLLSEEKADSEREFADRLAGLEGAHRTEMQKRESLYQTKIMTEVERYQALQAEVGAQTSAWKSKRGASEAGHASTMARVTNELERRLEEVKERRAGLIKDVDGGRQDWGEMRAQMENDLDDEVSGTRRAYQDRLDGEREQALKYKGENGIMKKKFAALQRDIEENKDSIRGALERQEGLRRVIDGLDKEIALLRSQIYDRDVTIGEKEKKIYELKKKNQELEKFKFVLDYKIKELKGQVEPREAEIAALRAQVKEVDSELEAYHKSNTDLDSMIGELRASLDSLQTDARNLRSDMNKKTAAIRDFSSELYTSVQVAKLPTEYVDAIKRLASKFVPHNLPPGAGDITVIAESERQREYLETINEQLRHKATVENLKNKAENGA
jgi:cilia- and flagella-associated protein 57